MHEVPDLGPINAERAQQAGPADKFLHHGELIRVATKYPIAKDYFTIKTLVTVEIIN